MDGQEAKVKFTGVMPPFILNSGHDQSVLQTNCYGSYIKTTDTLTLQNKYPNYGIIQVYLLEVEFKMKPPY